MTCEAQPCTRPGVYRSDHDAMLCDTHAEIPSYEWVRPVVAEVDYGMGEPL
jgi:isocitrate lyase